MGCAPPSDKGSLVTRIGINGLGRIGRAVLRLASARSDITVAGVNDLVDLDDMAYYVRHDSVHGAFPGAVETGGGDLVVDGETVRYTTERDPGDLDWEGVDVVVESTGAFRSREDAARHLAGGARRVLISAPSDDADVTVVPGVNDEAYDPDTHEVISLASCTTNCVAPVLRVLHDRFGVASAMFTTIHAYTASQSLVDGPSRKVRRGRAAALSLVPTTTGAANATELVLPSLAGRLDGIAVRAPVPDGSITDLVATLESDTTAEAVLAAFRDAAAGDDILGSVLGVSDEPLVSIDIVGDTHSALVDAGSIRMLDGQVKLLAWYDNEMGYAARLLDFAARI
ncbi:MAG: type I glyceraldehyde-3-phosphate dehydrogenase [Acidimicrobiia bacterium]|nr:type I glyceraldehyde-3-phosphate dehydrogenase [Acidimicrobiia bacterium]